MTDLQRRYQLLHGADTEAARAELVRIRSAATGERPVVIVSACSGHGFKFTPLIGKMAAELATAKG